MSHSHSELITNDPRNRTKMWGAKHFVHETKVCSESRWERYWLPWRPTIAIDQTHRIWNRTTRKTLPTKERERNDSELHWSIHSQMSLTSICMYFYETNDCIAFYCAYLFPFQDAAGVLYVCGFAGSFCTEYNNNNNRTKRPLTWRDYLIQPSAVNNRKHEHRLRHRHRLPVYLYMGIRCAISCINNVEKQKQVWMKWVIMYCSFEVWERTCGSRAEVVTGIAGGGRDEVK